MGKSEVKAHGSTVEVPLILPISREIGACGTQSGAVKCVDILRNTGGESGTLDLY